MFHDMKSNVKWAQGACPALRPKDLWRRTDILLAGLQSMAVSNEILGVQEQNNECASVPFYLSVHFKCAQNF